MNRRDNAMSILNHLKDAPPFKGLPKLNINKELIEEVRSLVDGVILGNDVDFKEKDDAMLLLYYKLFSKESKSRNMAYRVLSLAPYNNDTHYRIFELQDKFTADGEIILWMKNKLKYKESKDVESEHIAVLNIWIITIKFMGNRLFEKSAAVNFVNPMLTVVQPSLKTDSPVHLRKMGMKCWETLIKVYGINCEILASQKRINLLKKPLTHVDNSKNEEIIELKFKVWWTLISELGHKLPDRFSDVIIPFMKETFGSGSQILKSKDLKELSLSALYNLVNSSFSGDVSYDISRLQPLDKIPSPGILLPNISNQDFKWFYLALKIVGENVVDLNSKSHLLMFNGCYKRFSETLDMIGDNDETGKNYKSALITTFVDTSSKMAHTFLSSSHEKSKNVVMFMLKVLVDVLPANKILLMTCQNQITVIESIISIFIDTNLISIAKHNTSYFDIITKLLEKGTKNKIHALLFIKGIVMKAFHDEKLKNIKPEVINDVFRPLWTRVVLVANSYAQNGDINEAADPSISHNFTSFRCLLTFPIDHLIGCTTSSLWKSWSDLYKTVIMCVVNTKTYRSQEIEFEISISAMQSFNKLSKNITVFQFTNLCRIIKHITDNLSFAKSKKENKLSNLDPLCQLLEKLLITSNKVLKKTGGSSNGINTISSSIANIVKLLPPDLIRPAITLLSPSLVTLFGQCWGSYGNACDDAIETLLDKVISVLTTKFKGNYDVEFLQEMKSFVLTILTHPRRSIKTKGGQFFQLTFASLGTQIPNEISEVLRKNTTILSESSGSSFDSFPSQTTSAVMKSSLNTPKRLTTKTSSSNSPFKNLVKLTPSKTSIEDDDTQDFVPINNTTPSKRILTPHQKDVLTKRKDDIPALYSELSRDESSQIELPSQFLTTSSQIELENTNTFDGEALFKEKSQSLLDNQVLSTRKLSDNNSIIKEKKSDGQFTSSSNKKKEGISIKSLNESLPCSSPTVQVQKLSAKVEKVASKSPVKVLGENPLKIAETMEKSSKKSNTKRELNFFHENEDEIIPSSQNSTSEETVVNRKRKRDQSHSSGSTPNLKKRPKMEPSGKENNQFLKSLNKFGESPLHIAVKKGDQERVLNLLNDGNEMINHRDHAGWLPIHESINNKKNSLAIIELLLNHGADVNATGGDNEVTPLHEAVMFMPKEAIITLLNAGANPNTKNKQGKSVYDVAPTSIRKILLENSKINIDGVEENITDKSPIQESTCSIVSSPGPIKTRSKRKEKDDSLKSEESSAKIAKINEEKVKEDLSVIPESMELNNASESSDKCTSSSSVEPQISAVEDNHEIVESESSNNKTKLKEKQNEDSSESSVPTSVDDEKDEEKSKIISLPKPSIDSDFDKKRKSLWTSSLAPSRGAKLLEMSKAAAIRRSDSTSSSPTIETGIKSIIRTPNKPWEKFAPSPSNASPSASILKRSISLGRPEDSPRRRRDDSPAGRRRQVQFSDPEITDQVEIPMEFLTKGMLMSKEKEKEEEEESQLVTIEPTPPKADDEPDIIYTSLALCDEPLSCIINQLTNKTWQKTAEKDFKDKNIATVGDLSRLSKYQALQLKGLKPPNLKTLLEVLKNYHKNYKPPPRKHKDETKKSKVVQALSLYVENQTPEEEEKTLKEIYERPSPSPTEEVQNIVSSIKETAKSIGEASYDKKEESMVSSINTQTDNPSSTTASQTNNTSEFADVESQASTPTKNSLSQTPIIEKVSVNVQVSTPPTINGESQTPRLKNKSVDVQASPSMTTNKSQTKIMKYSDASVSVIPETYEKGVMTDSKSMSEKIDGMFKTLEVIDRETAWKVINTVMKKLQASDKSD